MCFVGPLQTEYASTKGMIAATATTHADCSKRPRNHQPSAVTAASLAKPDAASQPTTCRMAARAMNATPTRNSASGCDRQSGSASSISRKTAGMRTNEMKATSHHVDADQSEPAVE